MGLSLKRCAIEYANQAVSIKQVQISGMIKGISRNMIELNTQLIARKEERDPVIRFNKITRSTEVDFV